MSGTPTAEPRTAIIDIGSNSIRLVVHQGPARLPAILFNEKVLAGLGRSLAATGAIDADAMALARGAVFRFAALARAMEVDTVRTVATAAVRDAANGAALIALAREAGLTVETLSGEAEAEGAGHGVLSGIPGATGIVGDLGGGSLELVRVADGAVGERASFPLGVLRLSAIGDETAMQRRVAELLDAAGWTASGRGRPFFLVGGSWRALARLHMHVVRYPLPVIHQYALSTAAIAQVRRTLQRTDKATLKAIPGLSSGRIPTLPGAAALLSILMKRLGSSDAIVSSHGLREGLMYAALPADQRALDPLIVAARDEGRREGRFAEHGDVLERWIAAPFAGEDAAHARLRHAACLLADVGWRANPEFRAERGVEIALHGNWVGIDGAGRALLAQALWTSLGGRTDSPAPLPTLATAAGLRRAVAWGLAMRLGQRLSAGLAAPLLRTRLSVEGGALLLAMAAEDDALLGEAVVKRHHALAAALSLRAETRTISRS